jgi:ribulose kinase
VKDDGLTDLARKYNLTLESIALQTRHIVDEMNVKGHSITSIYMSGSQAKNIPMMQLFANTCKMPVVLPYDAAGAVVSGAAMLGRFAAEASIEGKMMEEKQAERLWNIMVRHLPLLFCL